MTTINVALSTTKYSLIEDPIRHFDIPVCSANFCIFDTLQPSEKEAFEHRWAQICLKMAQIVIVDSKNQTIYIGENPQSEEGGLIEYEEKNPGIYAKHFFEKWDEVKTLVFEFVVKNLQNKTIFCVKGIWFIDKWKSLDVIPTENITVV